MQLGIVGLGRMGGNIARRLMRAGHRTVVHDRNREAITGLEARAPKARTTSVRWYKSSKRRAQCGSCCRPVSPPSRPSRS